MDDPAKPERRAHVFNLPRRIRVWWTNIFMGFRLNQQVTWFLCKREDTKINGTENLVLFVSERLD